MLFRSREDIAAALKLDISDTPKEPVADVTTDETVEAEPDKETPAPEVLEPPTHWPADQRETFVSLPRVTQEWLLNRDKEMSETYTRKTTDLANQRKEVDEFNNVLEPYKQRMELAGIRPSQAIQQLLAAQRFLETNPTDALKWLAQQYQVDLSGFAPKEEESYVDPTVKALKDELNQIKSQLQFREQAQRQQSTQEVQQTIKTFAETKAEDGSLKYPHFERVKAQMAPMVAEGKTLEQAYADAIYVLPEVRERLAAENAKAAQAEATKKAEEARRQKAKEVKGATQVIRSRGTAVEDAGKNQSLRQELAANLAAQQSGRI